MKKITKFTALLLSVLSCTSVVACGGNNGTTGGTGKETGKRHPTLGDNVMVGSGAKVLGPVRLGNNTKIASGAVVLRDIPENSTAVGIPAKVVRRGGVRVTDDLDQIHIPDPVAQQFRQMEETIAELRREIEILKQKNGESTNGNGN